MTQHPEDPSAPEPVVPAETIPDGAAPVSGGGRAAFIAGGVLLVIGYIVAGVLFWMALVGGAVVAGLGITRSNGLQAAIGVGIVLVALALNLLITRGISGRWRLTWPNVPIV